jgi:ubiquinone/menaquinone biosynthesis C-methylase UbiE
MSARETTPRGETDRGTEDGTRRHFVPAAGHDWFLPLYDPVQKLLGADAARQQMIERAELAPGQRVLEIGCGTGSLLLQIAAQQPEVELVGLDPDPKALSLARSKCERRGVATQLDAGFSDALPYAEASFDRVFSSFMFHHLDAAVKRATLAEVRRVLRPGGSLHLLDFGGPAGYSGGWLAKLLHASDHLRDNFEGRIGALMAAAGFASPEELSHRTTWFGRVAHYRGLAPGLSGA